ncbi:DUF3718 domain-containing protein [Cognaticolwellia beringensis]|uniref:DUF3718 domain-containing protein n=1 Tax=Cognaticolwellia beringensis TaxID=1967665 RepID=A0A222G5D9_9GAMM|nr:DUF3718 domain-containing protein [Cognaticolwellia beringensis]ASP46952.1 DUF3718 domain-containing protein [Cognaticolwellia beringensis]
MKTTLLASLVLASAFSYTPQSVAFDDSISLRICEYVSINDKKRLRKYLKTNNVNIRSIFDNVQCNGQNLLEFAATSNALDIGEYLIGKLPVKTVSNNLAVIKKNSAHLTKIANERIK